MKFSEVGPPCFNQTSGPPTITSGFLLCFVLQYYADCKIFTCTMQKYMTRPSEIASQSELLLDTTGAPRPAADAQVSRAAVQFITN